jgi:hypothetical protein
MRVKSPTLCVCLVTLVIASWPALAATEVANGYKCAVGASPEKLIRAFIEKGALPRQPYEVADAIHAYAARPGLTAFGFPLVAVIGWQENSEFFGRGPGTAPPVHFSLVVQASPWQLAGALRKQGISPASPRGKPTYPHVLVTSFNSDAPDTLPPGADARYVYAQVTCNPRN